MGDNYLFCRAGVLACDNFECQTIILDIPPHAYYTQPMIQLKVKIYSNCSPPAYKCQAITLDILP